MDPPLKSIYVVRDGLPVFHQNFAANDGDGEKGEQDEMLVSGFLSALTAFMKDMNEFGDMRELRTSSNLKFSFYQKESLLFVACSDDSMSPMLVESLLKRLSMKFLRMYQKKLDHSPSMVNSKDYLGFERIIHREILSNNLRDLLTTDDNAERVKSHTDKIPTLLLPLDRIKREYYVRGALPDKILPLINGKRSIPEIASAAGLDLKKTESYLRYLVKEGILKE
jgi:hypothetical protein